MQIQQCTKYECVTHCNCMPFLGRLMIQDIYTEYCTMVVILCVKLLTGIF